MALIDSTRILRKLYLHLFLRPNFAVALTCQYRSENHLNLWNLDFSKNFIQICWGINKVPPYRFYLTVTISIDCPIVSAGPMPLVRVKRKQNTAGNLIITIQLSVLNLI